MPPESDPFIIQVKDLSDEELEKYLLEVHGTTVTWVCESSAALEALRRYEFTKRELGKVRLELKNKKAALEATESLLNQKGNECEKLMEAYSNVSYLASSGR